MKMIERRIFRLQDKIERLREEATLVAAELDRHRLIDEDAQRDAAFGNYIDAEEAQLTSADVQRFDRSLRTINDRITRLDQQRSKLIERLDP
ncbi:MAG: hypothetical protein GEU79_17615 [Acidimicrobiia bacterium]|nr:hypothetical protein [Acidimicrobiia bacterium]